MFTKTCDDKVCDFISTFGASVNYLEELEDVSSNELISDVITLALIRPP